MAVKQAFVRFLRLKSSPQSTCRVSSKHMLRLPKAHAASPKNTCRVSPKHMPRLLKAHAASPQNTCHVSPKHMPRLPKSEHSDSLNYALSPLLPTSLHLMHQSSWATMSMVATASIPDQCCALRRVLHLFGKLAQSGLFAILGR